MTKAKTIWFCLLMTGCAAKPPVDVPIVIEGEAVNPAVAEESDAEKQKRWETDVIYCENIYVTEPELIDCMNRLGWSF